MTILFVQATKQRSIMTVMGKKRNASETVVAAEGANIQVCPYCDTQVEWNPRKPRKTLRCTRCTCLFPILPPDGTGACAYCGVPIAAPLWVVGETVLCPDCKGKINLTWDDERGD